MTNFSQEADRQKRENFLSKMQQEEQRSPHKNKDKPVYAFGSSTPRVLTYLENLPAEKQVLMLTYVHGILDCNVVIGVRTFCVAPHFH